MRFSPREFLLSWWPPHLRRELDEAKERAREANVDSRRSHNEMLQMQRYYGQWMSERYAMPELRVVEPCSEYAFPVLTQGPVISSIHEEQIKMETFVCHFSLGLHRDIEPELVASRLGRQAGAMMENAILARYRSQSALLKGAA